MKYFNNLPIIDINDLQFRNLFKRVVVNQIREDQLRNYRIQEYETLPSIANKIYGTPEYWWVIALLNNISDINFDISLPTEQIEFIATELATEKRFSNSLLQSSIIQISAAVHEYEITFINETNSDYIVLMTPVADGEQLELIKDVEFGYEKINNTTFKINIQDNIPIFFHMVYAVFKIPEKTENVNTAMFVEYFDKLLREADDKRIIRLIKEQDLGYFITQFLLALRSELGNGNIRSFRETINALREYPDVDDPQHGLIVDLNSGTLLGDGKFTSLDIDNYDFDFHIYLSPKPTVDQLGDIGIVGIRSNFIRPRVYNTGQEGIDFDYLVVSPDDKKFSSAGEIIQSGIAKFGGVGTYTIITLQNSDQLLTEGDIGVMITPIIDRLSDFEAIGKFGFVAIDKNTFYVFNTGSANNRFFWSVFKNMITPFYNIFPGFVTGVTLPVGYSTDDIDKIGAYISPALFNTWESSGNVGAVAFKPQSTSSFEVINTGLNGDLFNFNVIIEDEYGEVLTDVINGVNVIINNDPNIVEASDICIVINIKSDVANEIQNVGDISVELIDKNQVNIHNTGLSNLPLRYNIIHNALQHGIASTSGLNNYTTININSHPEIVDKSQICIFITPLYRPDDYDINEIGEITYLAISSTEVRIYNTGVAGIAFKWILTVRQ